MLFRARKGLPAEWTTTVAGHLKNAPLDPEMVRFFVREVVERVRLEKRSLDQVNQVLVDAYLRIARQRAAGGSPPKSSPAP